MDLPFDGAISQFHRQEAPAEIWDTDAYAPAPWTVIRSDDKRRARVNAKALGKVDRDIAGGAGLWHA